MSARTPAQVADQDQQLAKVGDDLDRLVAMARRVLDGHDGDRWSTHTELIRVMTLASPDRVAMVAGAALVRLAEQGGEAR